MAKGLGLPTLVIRMFGQGAAPHLWSLWQTLETRGSPVWVCRGSTDTSALESSSLECHRWSRTLFKHIEIAPLGSRVALLGLRCPQGQFQEFEIWRPQVCGRIPCNKGASEWAPLVHPCRGDFKECQAWHAACAVCEWSVITCDGLFAALCMLVWQTWGPPEGCTSTKVEYSFHRNPKRIHSKLTDLTAMMAPELVPKMCESSLWSLCSQSPFTHRRWACSWSLGAFPKQLHLGWPEDDCSHPLWPSGMGSTSCENVQLVDCVLSQGQGTCALRLL